MSDPMPILDRSAAIDQQRLRAGLRVILPVERAERAADQILGAPDQLAGLRQLAIDLETERWFRKATSWLARSRADASESSRHRDDAFHPRSALMLIAHIGANVDGERLEDAFGMDAKAIGDELFNARKAFSEESFPACPEFGWIVGRYRDKTLAAEERVRFLSHATTCDGCSLALDHVQQADLQLTAAIERQLELLPDRPVTANRGRIGSGVGKLALAGSAVVALLALVVGMSAISGLFTDSPRSTPLFETDAHVSSALDGWLLQVSPVGYLEAVNLETGRKRGLDSGDGGGFSPLYRVSDTHIAAWRPSDGQREDVLTIGRIGEPPSHRMTWNRHAVYWYPSGWLGDHTLLIVKSPEHIRGESEQQYVQRLETESQLVAFDALTGDERVLMIGNVAAAYPSPDGTMLAILHPIDRDWPGGTLEIRPIDGHVVGAPVAQIDHRLLADGFWLPDSSGYITTLITDASVRPIESIRGASLVEHGVREIALARIALDGSQQVLETAEVPASIVPLGASPDAASVVYQTRSDPSEPGFGGATSYRWDVRQLSLSNRESVLLTSGKTPERVFRPAWSPDGTTLVLPVARAFPLSTDGQIDQPTNPNATTLLVFDPDWMAGDEPRAIYSSGRDLYGWLSPGALDARSSDAETGSRSLAMLEQSQAALDLVALGSGSVAADSGAYVVARERSSRLPLIWSVQGQRSRLLDAGISDLSWFNEGTVTIGVGTDLDGTAGSRIVLTVANISSSVAYLDHRVYDPANLAENSSLRYAQPLVSPSGTTVSFFVVERQAGSVTLWLDDTVGPARPVSTWLMPTDRAVDAQLVARWADNDTLLLALPDDWRDGVPGRVVFLRVSVEGTGDATVVELASLDPIRSAQGVVLVEMELSPDRTMLAYRLRHVEDGTTVDTLHVARTDSLDRAIEIERGGSGDGLAWTATGDAVVAGVRGRVVQYSADGRDLAYLSPRGVSASAPLVVDEQVWFDVAVDGSNDIWQVSLGDD